jgi:hypothetical protein
MSLLRSDGSTRKSLTAASIASRSVAASTVPTCCSRLPMISTRHFSWRAVQSGPRRLSSRPVLFTRKAALGIQWLWIQTRLPSTAVKKSYSVVGNAQCMQIIWWFPGEALTCELTSKIHAVGAHVAQRHQRTGRMLVLHLLIGVWFPYRGWLLLIILNLSSTIALRTVLTIAHPPAAITMWTRLHCRLLS